MIVDPVTAPAVSDETRQHPDDEMIGDVTSRPSLSESTRSSGKSSPSPPFDTPIATSQLRKMLDLLVHASQCPSTSCQYLNCRKVKGLFRHGMQCKTRASGGCVLCKKMWELIHLHAHTCKESQCHVPRCRDLKDHDKLIRDEEQL